MATRINRTVIIDGQRRWIHANTEQEYADKLLSLYGASKAPAATVKHSFREYALNWFATYSMPNVATATATTYRRQLNLYLLPHFGDMALEDITTDDVQSLFNGIDGAKSTKNKVKDVLNQILDAAVDDKIISASPLKSRRLKITGRASKTTDVYSLSQMRYLVQHIGDIQNAADRAYMALQALHPLRLEEVLGLKWEDIDMEVGIIHIRRAVTHPTRNQPEIKDTKTAASVRDVGLSATAKQYLTPGDSGGFVLGGDKPLSYTQVRKMCDRIKNDTGFSENVTPIRFRTTTLTDLYEQCHDVKQVQAAAGHTSPTMTLKHYVKGRAGAEASAAAIDRAYSGAGE